MTKKAFTFIELIIVISIIILISSTWVIYFFKQVSGLKINSEIENIVDIIDNLDSQVYSKKILDYKINIDKNNNKLGFIYNTNNLWLDYKQYLNLDFETWTWILSTDLTSTWSSYSFKIYSGIKFQWKYIIDGSDTISKNFNKNINSKIVATLSWNTLNDIYVNYYSPDNIIQNNENKLELTWIYNNNNKTWTNYNNIIIQNINWKKSIIPNLGSWINKVYLFFEREWVEKFIEIKK